MKWNAHRVQNNLIFQNDINSSVVPGNNLKSCDSLAWQDDPHSRYPLPIPENLAQHVYNWRPPSVYPDSKVHGANMGSIWVRQDPSGSHVDPMNFAIWVGLYCRLSACCEGPKYRITYAGN